VFGNVIVSLEDYQVTEVLLCIRPLTKVLLNGLGGQVVRQMGEPVGIIRGRLSRN